MLKDIEDNWIRIIRNKLQHGITGSSAGTALKNMLLGLEPHTKKAADLMKDLGISAKQGAADSFYQLNGNLKPLPEIIDILNQKFGGLNDKQKEAALAATFTKYGLAGLNTIVGESRDKFLSFQKELKMDDAATIAAKKYDNLHGDFIKLGAAMQTMGKAFGDTLAPALRGIVEGATKVVAFITQLPKPIKEAGLVALGLASALMIMGGKFIVTGIALNMMRPGLIYLAQSLGLAEFSIMGVAGALLEMMAPILLVGVAIAGLAYIWTHNLGGIQQKAQAVWAFITSTFNTALSAIEKVVNEALSAITKWWNDNWTTMQQAFTNVMKVLVAVLTPTVLTMTTIISAGIGFIKGAWQSGWAAIQSYLKMVWDLMKGEVEIAWHLISGIVSVALDLLSGNFKKAGSDFVNIFKNIWSDIKSMFSSLAQDAFSFGANFVHMMANGITGAISSVTSAVSNVAGQIKNFLGFHSPTKSGPASESDVWAPNFVNMMAKGIQEHTPKIQAAVNGIALSMKTGVTAVNHNISQQNISIPSNRTTPNGGTNIYISIDGRSAKTDNYLAEIIAHKIYRQMPVVS